MKTSLLQKSLTVIKQLSPTFWILVLLTILPLWLVEQLAFQDYSGWVIQGAIVCEMFGNGEIVNLYSWQLSPLPPNALPTVILALLQTVLSPDAAGRVFLTVMTFAVALRVYRIAGEGSLFQYFGFLVILNIYFYWGFLPFLAAVSSLVYFLPSLLNPSDRKRNLGLLLLGGSLLTYLLHGFIYGIFMGAVLCRWATDSARRQYWPVGNYAALLPSALLLLWYIFNVPPHSHSEMTALYNSLLHWAQELRYGALPLPRFAGLETALPLSIINSLFWLLVATAVVLSRKDFAFRQPALLFLLLMAVAAVLNPFFRIGNFMKISPRVIPVILLSLPLLSNQKVLSKPVARRLANGAIILLAVSQFFYLFEVDSKVAQANREIGGLEKSAKVLVIGKLPAEDFDKRPLQILSGVVQPFIRVNYLDRYEAGDKRFNVQETSIIRLNSDDHLLTVRKADRLFDAIHSRADLVNTAMENQAWLADNFDQILLYGSVETRNQFEAALSGKFRPVGSSGLKLLLARNMERALND